MLKLLLYLYIILSISLINTVNTSKFTFLCVYLVNPIYKRACKENLLNNQISQLILNYIIQVL